MAAKQTALALAEKGWHVFPVLVTGPDSKGKYAKKPMIDSWHNASDDPDRIEAMHWHAANYVGVHCEKSKVWIIDVDDTASLDLFQPPYTCQQETMRAGGKHYIYQAKEFDQRNGTSVPVTGQDVRANGGYFVWYDKGPLRHEPLEPWPFDAPMREVSASAGAAPGSDDIGSAEGNRNNSLASYLGGLRAKGFEFAELLACGNWWNNTYCKPALDSIEVLNVVNSILRYAPNDIPDDIDDINDPFYSFHGGFGDIPPMPKPETFCGEWLRAGSYTIIYARAGMGKTAVVTDLVTSLMRGRFWMGQITRKPKRIVWINGDMELWQIKERMGFLGEIPGVELVNVDGKDLMRYQDQVEAICTGADVVILDNFTALIHLEDANKAENWRGFNAFMKRIYGRGTAVILQQHEGKGEGTSAFGSSAQEWPATNIIRISTKELKEQEFDKCPGCNSAKVRKIVWHKHRMSAQPESMIFQLVQRDNGAIECDIQPFIDKEGKARVKLFD